MKTIAEIKRQVFENQPSINYHVDIKRVEYKKYKVNMHYGLGEDLKRLVNMMRIEGYEVV